MPIRFQCPNGHVIEVPDNLAGRRGTCQDCGAKVQVPAPRGSAAGSDPPTAAPVAKPASPIPAPNAPTVAPQPPPAPAAKPVARAVVKAKPTPPSPPQWCVRNAAGEQFGPTDEAVFRQWILEGRVAPESYVWREGWEEWKVASQAADELPAPLAPPALAPTAPPAGAPSPPSPPAMEPGSAASRYARKRSQQRQMRLFAALGLGILTLLLIGVLAWVLFKPEPPLEEPDPTPPLVAGDQESDKIPAAEQGARGEEDLDGMGEEDLLGEDDD